MSESEDQTTVHAEGNTLEEAIEKAHAGAEAQQPGNPDEFFVTQVVSLGRITGGFADTKRFTATVKPLR